jgi:NSS family neurotransmitter:Na+ symporter
MPDLTISSRETFTSRLTTIMTMIGVVVGLGNVWRFPYMMGKFGGTAFLVVYMVIVATIAAPALMVEWALGRHTQRGPVGAFEAGGLPGGRYVGWFFFGVVTIAMGYYSTVIGWILYHAIGEIASGAGIAFNAADVLPPDSGFVTKSFLSQFVCTGIVVGGCAFIVQKGLRGGIEKASIVLMPLLFIVLIALAFRSLTLPNAMEGVQWYLLKFRIEDLTAPVILAALGQVFFTLSLGGTFMVVYGSYLRPQDDLRVDSLFTCLGDTAVGLIAGFVIFPAVFSLGMEPTSGPALLFSTLPQIFDRIPAGWIFGFLFFVSLFGAAYLSAVAALEVLAAGLTDSIGISRGRAVWLMAGAVLVVSIPPSINMGVFLPWDLIFGSGMQILGSLLAVITFGWCMNRSAAIAELNSQGAAPVPMWMFHWIRFGIPAVIILLFVWWLLTNVFGTVAGI